MTPVYRIQVDPLRHELHVELTIEGPHAEGTVYVETPTWVPGDYEFATYGRDVFAIDARDQRTGEHLPVRRVGWQGYEISGCRGTVVVAYTASCTSTDFSEASGTVRDHYAVLLGPRYLLVAASPGPCRLVLDVPEGWPVHCASGGRRVDDHEWEFPSYEILLDTPIVTGNFDSISRDVAGTPFHHLFLNRGVGSAGEARFVDDVVKLAVEYHTMFGSFPFQDYTYVFSLDPRDDWGLEHLTSTMIGLGPAVFVDADQAGIGVRTCAHELFHAWNVRRLRPATLGELDFRRGSFTEGLWVAEGFTRYYEFLTCTRTGLYSPGQFFSSVVNYFRHLVAFPAYDRVSPVDASSATYLNHEKYPGRPNSAIDYYDAGMLLAFDLDVALRAAGDSLDAAFQAFYEAFVGRGAGWTLADLSGLLERRLPGLGELVIREATEPAALSVVERLAELGFRIGYEDVAYLGLVMQDDSGPAIYGVLDTSPAGASGIANEDIVTAVDGSPFALEALRWAVAHQSVVTLDVLRGNVSSCYGIPVGRRTQITSLAWEGDATQARRIARWLKADFTPSHGESIPLDFYENFHGVETVI